jgi:hypothetical protein
MADSRNSELGIHCDRTQELLGRLAAALTAQIGAHEALQALLGEEREALTHLDVATIHDCARRKAQIAERIGAAELERQSAAAALERGRRLRLGEIIERLPATETRAALTDLRRRLMDLMTAVSEGQARNRGLTESFLGVLGRSMEAVQEAVASLTLYNQGAHASQAKWRGCVLSQTA